MQKRRTRSEDKNKASPCSTGSVADSRCRQEQSELEVYGDTAELERRWDVCLFLFLLSFSSSFCGAGCPIANRSQQSHAS